MIKSFLFLLCQTISQILFILYLLYKDNDYLDDTNVLVYIEEWGNVIEQESEAKEILKWYNPFKGPYVGGVRCWSICWVFWFCQLLFLLCSCHNHEYRKGKIDFNVNDVAKKATYKKRKNGLFDKADELSTLYRIEGYAKVYGRYEPQPEIFPSPGEVQSTLKIQDYDWIGEELENDE